MENMKSIKFVALLFVAGCIADPSQYPFLAEDDAGGRSDAGAGDIGARDAEVSSDADRADMPDVSLTQDAPSTDVDPPEPAISSCDGNSCDCDPTRVTCSCDEDGKCTIDCRGAGCAIECSGDCEGKELGEGSSIRCSGKEAKCKAKKCEGDCLVECTGEESVCEVDCKGNARCELVCTGTDSECFFKGSGDCDDKITECGNRLVCNGACR